MDLSLLLHRLNDLGVVLRKEGDRLKVTAPPGTLTSDLSDAIRTHKSELLALVGEAPSPVTSQTEGVARVQIRDRHSLSPSQKRNLFAAQNGPGLPTAYAIKGPLKPEILTEVLNRIVARHGPLRTIFVDRGQGTEALVNPAARFPLDLQDYSGLEPAAREPAWRRALAATATAPFALDRGPLYRFQLYRLAPDEHILALVFSQMVFDGSSFDLFLKEMTEGYVELSQGRDWPSQELKIEYLDYVQWKDRHLEATGPDQASWWRQCLGAEVPGTPVPLDHPRPDVPTYKGAAVPLVVPGDLIPGLREFSKKQEVTTQLVMLGALFVLVSRLGGRADSWVATPVEGRRLPVFEPLIGTFVNMLLLRSDLDPEAPFETFLASLKDYFLSAYDHSDIPLEYLDLKMKKAEGDRRPPLFQVEFSYQQVSQRGTMMGPLSLSQVEIHGGGAANELTFWVKDWGHQINGALEYSPEIFDKATVAHWLVCYINVLRKVILAPGVSLGKIDLVAEERTVVHGLLLQALTRSPVKVPRGSRNLAIVDGLGMDVPLGTWGTLTADGAPLVQQIRLKSDGTLETRTVDDHPQRTSEKGRTRVFDPVEFFVIEQFKSVLNVPEVGLQNNFFDLGGHSLLAVRILSEVRKKFGARLSLSVFFEAPTPFTLSKLIRNECGLPDPETGRLQDGTKPQWTTVVPIQTGGKRPPLFVAAGVGGNPMNLRFVAKYLGDDQPFYGLQHRGTDGRFPPHRRIEAMAKEYAGDIKKVQTQGPYYLGGFSFGGTAIFETARELISQGDQVALVVMFDSVSPVCEVTPDILSAERHERMKRNFFRFLVHGINHRVAVFVEAVTVQLGAFLANFAPFTFRNQAVVAAAEESSKNYVARPLQVDVLVLRSEVQNSGGVDKTNGWGKIVTGNLKVIQVAGDHTTHVDDPFIRTNAPLLRAELDQVQKAMGSPV